MVTNPLQAIITRPTLRTEAFKTQEAPNHDPVEEAAARVPQHQRTQRPHNLPAAARGLGFHPASRQRLTDVHPHALHHLDVR